MSVRVIALVVVLCGFPFGEANANAGIRQHRSETTDGLIQQDEEPHPQGSGSMRRTIVSPSGEVQAEGSNSEDGEVDEQALDQKIAFEVEATKDADPWTGNRDPWTGNDANANDIANQHFGIDPSPPAPPPPSGATEPHWSYTASTDGYFAQPGHSDEPGYTGGNSAASSNSQSTYSYFDYELGNRGQTTCQPGQPVLSAAECRYALGELQIPLKQIVDNRLCYKDGAGNGYANGKNGGGASLVCRLEQEAPQTQGPSADDYVFTDQGSVTCPQGARIVSKTECETALEALSVPFVPTNIKPGNWCYKDGRGKGYANGRNGAGAFLICKK